MSSNSWRSSEVVTVNNNKFQSHITNLNDINEIKEKLDLLINGNKKITKASHRHIYAYNIPSKQIFGFNDNGESGAGEHLLKILKQHKPNSDHLLAVTRWNRKGIKLRQQKVSYHCQVRYFGVELVY